MKVFRGVETCLSLLHIDNLTLQTAAVGIIDHLAEDAEEDIRLMGGIPLLLGVLAGGTEARMLRSGELRRSAVAVK